MEHQDWTPVTLVSRSNQKKPNLGGLGSFKFDDNSEDFHHQKISKDNVRKVVGLRTQAKLTRRELALKCSLKEKDIIDIETGNALRSEQKINKVLCVLGKELSKPKM
jgi:ribosome-binding protein aMBF1 (putative translation factor)